MRKLLLISTLQKEEVNCKQKPPLRGIVHSGLSSNFYSTQITFDINKYDDYTTIGQFVFDSTTSTLYIIDGERRPIRIINKDISNETIS